MSLLYVVFIDESSNFKERNDEIIVHSILCINYRVLVEVPKTVNQILHDTRSRFNIRNLYELHAKEIVQIESYWNKVPLKDQLCKVAQNSFYPWGDFSVKPRGTPEGSDPLGRRALGVQYYYNRIFGYHYLFNHFQLIS